jgi:hypothetical protein
MIYQYSGQTAIKSGTEAAPHSIMIQANIDETSGRSSLKRLF